LPVTSEAMGKGGGGKGSGYGPKKVHAGRGKGWCSRDDDVIQRNQGPGDEAGESEEEEDEEEAKKEAKKPVVVLERDDDLEKELAEQFGTGGLTRKQREEIEEQERLRKEEKDMKEGKSDQAKEDMARLQEIRAKREEAVKKKEQEAEAAKQKAEEAAKAAASKDIQVESQKEVALAILDLVKSSKDQALTVNQLNQDANCKKVLKPKTKKCNVKAINKAWMEKYPELLKLSEDGGILTIRPA